MKIGDYVIVTSFRVINDLKRVPPKFRFGKVIDIKERWNPNNGIKLKDLITFRTAYGSHSDTSSAEIKVINIK